jgi:hypothetical protein
MPAAPLRHPRVGPGEGSNAARPRLRRIGHHSGNNVMIIMPAALPGAAGRMG